MSSTALRKLPDAMEKPTRKPARPQFSSGPTVKPKGWDASTFRTDVLGRSHRSGLCKGVLQEVIDKTRQVLRVPDTHRIAIVPASDTGAVEMAMWSLLGARPVTVAAWENFGQDWVTDALKQLKIDPTLLTADYGQLPDLESWDPSTDLVFTWNGTTSGVKVPNGNFIPDDREGLTICDATSAAFAMDLPWEKLDVVTYSWQKVMGGEAQHGMLIIGPKAVERLESHTPPWPLPKLFRMTKGGKLNQDLFAGATINTPSMLCVVEHLQTLDWAIGMGGLKTLIERADANAALIEEWVAKTPWVDYLCEEEANRTNTGVCLKFIDPAVTAMSEDDQRALVKKMTKMLEAENVAFDIAGYRTAPPSLRIWVGGTVEHDDVSALLPWIDYAYEASKPAA